MRTSYEVIAAYMSDRIRRAMLAVDDMQKENLSEVRLRAGKHISFVNPYSIGFLSVDGKVESSPTDKSLIVRADEIKAIVDKLCHYSQHVHIRELKNGCFVIENGIRVGAAGFCTPDSIIRNFSSLNFRIAREVKGCADSLFSQLYGSNIIICGGVNSGKTTLLRDLCRQFGNLCKVTLIDERNEISASVGGLQTLDVGLMTDVIVGSTRSDGIISAVRTLSPDYIFCDEIAEQCDAEAIIHASGCGVKFAAAIHAETYSQLMSRKVFRELYADSFFDYAVFLDGSQNPSSVREIRRLKNNV